MLSETFIHTAIPHIVSQNTGTEDDPDSVVESLLKRTNNSVTADFTPITDHLSGLNKIDLL